MKLSSFYYISTAIIISVAFLFGAYALEVNGIQYVSEGGNPLLKIHLTSYLGLMVFSVFVINKGFKGLSRTLSVFFKAWSFISLSIIYLIAYGLMKYGTSGMAYVVDTLLVPVLLFPIFLSLEASQKRQILNLLVFFVLLNSAVATYEYIKSQQVFEYIYEVDWVYFRSTAFLSHPLNNALILSFLSCFLFKYKIVHPVLLFLSVLLALFCFGARTATAIFIIFSFFELISLYRKEISLRGGLVFNEVIILKVVFFIGLFAIMYAVLMLGFGQRIFENIAFDGSARSRYDAFNVFGYLSFEEYLFGARPEFFENLMLYIDNSVVENFVIGWFLFYGIAGSLFIICFFYFFLYKLYVNADRSSKAAVLMFTVISISNNSMASKNPAFLFFLVAYAVTFNIDRNLRKQS
jgi:hypothetical protein